MTNPAIVEAKFKIAGAVAAFCDEGVAKFLPPRPSATTNEITTGIHASRSYLWVSARFKKIMDNIHQFKTLMPQKETNKEMTATITIPTLGKISG